jgi:hypothetical protein
MQSRRGARARYHSGLARPIEGVPPVRLPISEPGTRWRRCAERPGLLAAVTPASADVEIQSTLAESALRLAGAGPWQGEPNALSPAHGLDWPVIDEVAWAAHRGAEPQRRENLARFPSEGELFAPPVRSPGR